MRVQSKWGWGVINGVEGDRCVSHRTREHMKRVRREFKGKYVEGAGSRRTRDRET